MEKKRLSVLERLANARKEYESNKGGFDSNEDIFCKIKTEGVHQLRLVEAVYFDPEDGHEERT